MHNMNLQELMDSYDDAVHSHKWDETMDIEYLIANAPKTLAEMRKVLEWKGKEYLCNLGLPPFTLTYDEGHPDYDYDKEHFHIEVTDGCFLSQGDLEYLLENELHRDLAMYASHSGRHFHIFKDHDTLMNVVTDLNKLFGYMNE